MCDPLIRPTAPVNVVVQRRGSAAATHFLNLQVPVRVIHNDGPHGAAARVPQHAGVAHRSHAVGAPPHQQRPVRRAPAVRARTSGDGGGGTGGGGGGFSPALARAAMTAELQGAIY